LAGMETTPDLFHVLGSSLATIGKPIVCVMEGGYTPELLAEGVYETVQGLVGVCDGLETRQKSVQSHHKWLVDRLVASLS